MSAGGASPRHLSSDTRIRPGRSPVRAMTTSRSSAPWSTSGIADRCFALHGREPVLLSRRAPQNGRQPWTGRARH